MLHRVDNFQTEHLACLRPARWPVHGLWEFRHDYLHIMATGQMLIIPSGARVDLMTVPWWAWWMFHPDDPRTARAAAVHDWMCPMPHELLAPEYDPAIRPVWDQRVAAAEFYAILRADGYPRRLRRLLYAAVVTGIPGHQW